jgi:ribonuclease HII
MKNFIVGADEVGYGALSGPVVVCAVRAPKDWNLEGLNDSKKLSEKKRNLMREKLLQLVQQDKIQFATTSNSNVEIDKVGIAIALRSCYAEVYKKLFDENCLLIADGNLKFDELAADGYTVKSIVKADTLIPTVMAASILAKTYRDDLMKAYHKVHPNYGWESNVGYGSKDHLEAIAKYGPCVLHRISYAPMKNMGQKVDERQTTFIFES